MRLIILLNLLYFYINIAIAMEPDVEAFSNPKFVAKFNCSSGHFMIEGYFEKEDWSGAMKVIEGLESKGYADKALTMAKGKIFFKTGKYKKALSSFQRALKQKYKCYWTSYRSTYPPLKDLADQGIVWHYIYQIFMAMGMSTQADVAHNTSVDFLMQSLGLPPINNIDDKENAKITIGKIFLLYDLYSKPLWPFNPWSQDHRNH